MTPDWPDLLALALCCGAFLVFPAIVAVIWAWTVEPWMESVADGLEYAKKD